MAEANDRKMKKAKIVKAATLVLTLVNVAVFTFGASVVYSLARTNVTVVDLAELSYNINNPVNLTDDTLDYHINVTISNEGLYPMDGIEATLNCYVENSTNEMFLPPDTLFASATFTFGVIAPGNHSTTRVALHVTPGLNITIDCWLRNEFNITTSVVQFPISVAGIFFAHYNAPP